MPTFRSEAAVGLGIIGTVILVAIQVSAGALSVEDGRLQIEAIASTALVPLLTGIGTRALVWSRDTVTRLLGDPEGLAARVVREHGAEVLDQVVQAGIREGQARLTQPSPGSVTPGA